jgi:DNA-binding NtrC family response regulator
MRREDIPSVIQHFIRQNTKNSNKRILGVTPEAMEILTAYDWPGNIRELRNVIDYAFVLCPGGGIGVEHLPQKITARGKECGPLPGSENLPDREKMIQVLRETEWNQSKAARKLGVSRVTVWKRMQNLGIRRPV